MNYPLISEYIEAIKAAEDNFEELSYLRPVLSDDGLPVMTSGNFAVVFKMKDERNGKFYAVKCFTKEQEGRSESYKLIADELEYISSNYLTPIKYFEDELFVDTNNSEKDEFPVLLMDWVEGKTLDVFIKENINNQYALEMVAYQFGKMASWLLTQSFAHGDLKPDNIIIKDDGTLVLVDYDGMYVPAMKGQKAREIGSPGFRHPSRTKDVFDEHVDDFSIATISLALKAIALKPSLWNEYGSNDRLLFKAEDFSDLSRSECIAALQALMNDPEFCTLYGIFMIAWAKNDLSQISFRLLNINKSSKEDLQEVVSLYVKADEFIKAQRYGDAYKLFSSLSRKGKKASVLGYNGLGYMCAYGLHVPKDEIKAASFFKQAADQGWATSIFNLGICYEKGIGVDRDRNEANRLYHIAAEKNFGPAVNLETWVVTYDPFVYSKGDVQSDTAYNKERGDKIVSTFYL